MSAIDDKTRINALGVYIHYPYCDKKCDYCDFYSLAETNPPTDFEMTYLRHLKNELKQKKEYISANYYLASIFFGGGTPSKASGFFIQSVIDLIAQTFSKQKMKKIEITLEANPESLSAKKINEFLQAGINRFSIGVQTRNEDLIGYLGRIYNREKINGVFKPLKAAAIANFSADLIYGIPSQTIKCLDDDLNWLIDNQVNHISAYSLTVEKGTRLYSDTFKKNKKTPSESRQLQHREFVREKLVTAGFTQYEISNFARPGYECLHNKIYWQYRPYLSLGVAGHSFLNQKRFIAPKNLSNYESGHYFDSDNEATIADIFIGGLRLLKYQSFAMYKIHLSKSQFLKVLKTLMEFQTEGYAKVFPRGFQMTQKGILYSDQLLLKFADI